MTSSSEPSDTAVPAISHAPSLDRGDSEMSVASTITSASISEDDTSKRNSLRGRPKLGSRKSSGSMIISRESTTVMATEEIDEGDVRSMSPRRSSAELDRLSEAARRDLIEQARVLQTSLQAIVDRVETVKSEHEKLEGGNKFLQSYIGELMQTSKITSTSMSKKGKTRVSK